MRKTLTRGGLLALAAAAGFALRGCSVFTRPVTVTSLSPDDSLRVAVVERPAWLDRNFEVRLEDVSTREARTVYRSPDEGLRVGSERFVWSTDGSRFLLLGRHFYVTEQGKLPSGELAYLMMDVRTGQAWCNTRQRGDRELPGFGPAELRAVTWAGWTP